MVSKRIVLSDLILFRTRSGLWVQFVGSNPPVTADLREVADRLADEVLRLRTTLEAYAYWWPIRRPYGRGQAKGTAHCGHSAPVGAPYCRNCARRLIDQALAQRAVM